MPHNGGIQEDRGAEMNDKQIRSILIAWLQTQSREARIYQEKSIGAAVCDVMVASDRLAGYEIKSDRDNYERLERQVSAYDCFFDANWLVVSDRHLASAKDHVPEHWGILCIRDDAVVTERAAKPNTAVSRRSQLSILWKLELKNILIRHALPLYAQQGKGYIADRIAEQVPPETLGREIAGELLRRDYSVWDTEDRTAQTADGTSDLPEQEIVDALSEKDPAEYTLDQWIALYRRAKEVREVKESIFHVPPAKRLPHAVAYTDIEVCSGAPWIHPHIIAEFISWLLDIQFPKECVAFEPVTGSWSIHGKNYYTYRNTRAVTTYGLERFSALHIIEATLNLREIRIMDSKGRCSERDTLAALEKQKRIIQEFKSWIWQDADRRWEVEEAYNRIFAQFGTVTSSGSALTFPEMAPDFSLFPYQKDAVQRILQTPNTLLAFDVGAGKTYIMIAAAMTLRREGTSRKNMFVVPNHIVGQWEKIFTSLYPRAKVLAIEPKGFKPEIRQKVLRQIRDGDYDGIIIAYSCFELIPLRSATVLDNISGQLRKIDSAVNTIRYSERIAREAPWQVSLWGETPLRREKEYLQKLTADFLQSMEYYADNGIMFEDLEITTLFLDEAHNYKNLPIRTHLKNLNGINTKGSMKCLDMLHKVRCVQRSEIGRGAVFATGTPLCNSIADAYTMQVYLQIETLEKTNLDQFDNWVKTFAEPEQVLEVDVNASRLRMTRRFARFHNLPELAVMFSQIAMFYAVEDSGQLPQQTEHVDSVIRKYPALTAYMESLCARTEAIRSRKINPRWDNMLKVSTDGRKAALDLRLVGREQPAGDCSKIDRCVENVAALYRSDPNTTQLIFCDYSTPKARAFNVYQTLKERLCARGIPAKEIAFIHSYGTESRKLELFRKFNAGEMRILVGSTFKLGIGANVQVKLKAIHHLDVPWRPADMVQREGRMLRRGNENDSVRIYRYIAEGSFDSYAWQILERKQRFISQFLSGSSYQRTAADLEDNVLTYAEVKALALSEPRMKQFAEKENELKSLRLLRAQELESQTQMRETLAELEQKLPELRKRLDATEANAQHLAGQTECAFRNARASLKGVLTEDRIRSGSGLTVLGTILDFEILLPEAQDEGKPFVCLCRLDASYPVEMGASDSGNAQRVVNQLKRFDKLTGEHRAECAQAEKQKTELAAQLTDTVSAYEDRIRACEAEISSLLTAIRGGSADS